MKIVFREKRATKFFILLPSFILKSQKVLGGYVSEFSISFPTEFKSVEYNFSKLIIYCQLLGFGIGVEINES